MIWPVNELTLRLLEPPFYSPIAKTDPPTNALLKRKI